MITLPSQIIVDVERPHKSGLVKVTRLRLSIYDSVRSTFAMSEASVIRRRSSK